MKYLNIINHLFLGLTGERDQYMASVLRECGGNVVVGVVGAAHVYGIMEILEKEEVTNGVKLRHALRQRPSQYLSSSY